MTRMLDEGHTVDVIYLDFAKAFDSDNHIFLLAKMKSFGLGRSSFWSGLDSTRQWRTLGGHSNAQWCSAGLRGRAIPVSPFHERPPRGPRNTDVAVCG